MLVTGATGFCGRHLCRDLVQKKYRVVGTCVRKHRAREKELFPLYKLDLRETQSVDSLIARMRPDFICHLAAQSVPRFSWRMQEETFAVNVAGTIYLLDALRRYSPKTRLLHASTIQVYGRSFQSGKALKEKDLLWPIDPYAASKAISEHACREFACRFGLQIVIARAFNHLGPGQPVHHAFSDWCRQIVHAEMGLGQPVLKVGDLNNRRDFLHIRDVLNAYELLMKRGKSGEVYNVCSEKAYPLSQFVDQLIKRAKVRVKVVVDKSRVRFQVASLMKGDASKLKALGWKPRFSPLDALEDLLNEWRWRIRADMKENG